MDLKFKGRAFVGSIYHKFEAMCQEVDDFVNQDKVKYVENQVQTVGESMKRFCSGVVQELLPPLADPVKHETQAATPKQDDAIGDYIRSLIGTEETIDVKKSTDPVDPSKQVLPPSSAESDLSDLSEQVFPPSPAYTIREQESYFSLRPEDDSSTEETIDIKKSTAPLDPSKQVLPPSSAESDFSDLSEQVFPPSPAYTIREQESYFSLRPEDDSSTEETIDIKKSTDHVDPSKHVLPPSSAEFDLSDLPELVFPPSPAYTIREEESDFSLRPEEDSSTEPQLARSVEENVLPSNSLHHEELLSSQKEGKCHNSISDELEVVSDVLSTLPSSSSSSAKEAYSMSELYFPPKAEDIIDDPMVAIECASDLSKDLSTVTVVSLESNDVNTSRTDEVVSLAGSSGSRYGPEWTGLEAFMSSLHSGSHGNAQGDADDSDDSIVDIADPSMETIELSDEGKLDASCVIVDDKLVFQVSNRSSRSRSYKKLIQDAFTSKKRLIKEYRQLPIWYGDVDIDFSQHLEQNVLPSIRSMSLNSKKSPTQDLCDSDWELL